MTSWHTRLEREAIKIFGGKPLRKYGTDGVIRGRPVEVRATRKDHRYRIQRNVHHQLVRNQGSYIFCDKGRCKKIPARQVSRLMGRGRWFKDRTYPHRFLEKKKVFT